MGESIRQRYLRPVEAATFLGVEPAAIRQFPDLPYSRVGPKTIRYDIVDLEQYRNRLPLPADATKLAKLITDKIGRRPATGFVYFMQCRELVKVGYSIEPPRRRDKLQAFIPFELRLLGALPGSITAERELHAAFASIKYERLTEWFYSSPALLDAIQIVTRQEATIGT